ncbi:hypothetical protein FB645_000149 [Coemansia sp. IMI 203386]|nr:hypothetical protein FB645_000149 [Coemansia sp. IMI 203386]
MERLAGKKVSRDDLFENEFNSGSSKKAKTESRLDSMLDEEDEQDFAAFERMMEARIKEQIGESIAADAASSSSEDDSEGGAAKNSSDNGAEAAAPVFRLFAGAGPVKVETQVAEPVYIQPQRPESSMVESDTEEHWRNLAAAAIDSQTVVAMSKIPQPTMAFSHRVMHIKLDSATDKDSAQEPDSKKLKRRKKKKTRSEPYRKTPSPYNGGVIKAKMLEDVIREQEKAASDARARAAARGRGRGGSRGMGRGHGRGRGFSGSAGVATRGAIHGGGRS